MSSPRRRYLAPAVLERPAKRRIKIERRGPPRLDVIFAYGSSACADRGHIEQSQVRPGAERWPSGRRHQIANLAYWVTGTEGSNPSLSAIESADLRRISGPVRSPKY